MPGHGDFESDAGQRSGPGSAAARHRARSIEAAAAAGIAYAVLSSLTLFRLSRFPDLDLSEQELTEWFDDAGNQTLLIGSLSLASVASVAFLWFVAVIRRRLGDQEDQFFATVFFGSAIVYVGVWLVGAAVLAAPAVAMTQLDAAEVSSPTASLAGGIGASLILVVAPRLQAVFMFTTSSVILRSRVLPTWLAVVGYVAGLLLFLLPLVTQPTGVVFPVWVLAVSLVLLLSRPEDLGVDPSAADDPPQ